MAADYPSFEVIDRPCNGYLSWCLARTRKGDLYSAAVENLARLADNPPPFEIVQTGEHIIRNVADGHGESEFERLERQLCGELVRTWRGTMQPFAAGHPHEENEAIIADLDADLPVGVSLGGFLTHLPTCARVHRLRRELRDLPDLEERYSVEIAYRFPPAHPIMRSLDPEIVEARFPDDPPPHLLVPVRGLCVLFPSDQRWSWEKHGAREYADYTAIWLAKHTVWLATRKRLGQGNGIWVGEAVPHGAQAMVARLRPDDECHCGSARPYGSCCRRGDREMAQKEQSGVMKRSAARMVSVERFRKTMG